MALPDPFIIKSRARITAFLLAFEDMVSLQNEFNAIGGVTFTNLFNFNGENASVYDITQGEYNAALTALGRIITAAQGTAVTSSATALGDLYKAKS
jgi:hypothetical protein